MLVTTTAAPKHHSGRPLKFSIREPDGPITAVTDPGASNRWRIPLLGGIRRDFGYSPITEGNLPISYSASGEVSNASAASTACAGQAREKSLPNSTAVAVNASLARTPLSGGITPRLTHYRSPDSRIAHRELSRPHRSTRLQASRRSLAASRVLSVRATRLSSGPFHKLSIGLRKRVFWSFP